jgi:hypothetical protein
MLRMKLFKPGSRRLTLTGLAWLVLAAYLISTGTVEWLSEPREYYLLIAPALGLISLFAAFGFLASKAFTRGIVVFVAGLGLFGASATFIAFAKIGFPFAWPFQVFLVACGLFFAWSLVLVIWLWPAHRAPRPAAG